jgi:hypothetical protein
MRSIAFLDHLRQSLVADNTGESLFEIYEETRRQYSESGTKNFEIKATIIGALLEGVAHVLSLADKDPDVFNDAWRRELIEAVVDLEVEQ